MYTALPSAPAPAAPTKVGNTRLILEGYDGVGKVKEAAGAGYAGVAIALLISSIEAPLHLTGVNESCDK